MQTKISKLAQPYLLRVMEVDKEKIAFETSKIWESVKDEIEIKGFRKGKAPKNVVEKQVGFQQLYKKLIDDLVRSAIPSGENEIGRPIVEIQQIHPEQLSHEGIILQVVCYLKPQARVDCTNLFVEKSTLNVTKEMVQIQLDKLRESQAIEIPIEGRGVEFGDIITLSFCGMINGIPFKGGTATDYKALFSENTFIPDMTQAILGMQVGEKKTIDVVFPTDYHATQLAGVKAQFDLELSDICRRDLPEINDEFAQSQPFSQTEMCQSLDQLKERIVLALEQQQAKIHREQVEQQVLTQLLQRADIDPIPQSMVTRQLEELLHQQARQKQFATAEEFLEKANMSREQFDQTYYHSIVRDMKVQLILDAVAQQEAIVVGQDEYENYLAAEAPKYGMTLDQLKNQVLFESVREKIRIKRAYEIILSKVQEVEKKNSELKAIVGEGEELASEIIT